MGINIKYLYSYAAVELLGTSNLQFWLIQVDLVHKVVTMLTIQPKTSTVCICFVTLVSNLFNIKITRDNLLRKIFRNKIYSLHFDEDVFVRYESFLGVDWATPPVVGYLRVKCNCFPFAQTQFTIWACHKVKLCCCFQALTLWSRSYE